jgi:hypothetical protein
MGLAIVQQIAEVRRDVGAFECVRQRNGVYVVSS